MKTTTAAATTVKMIVAPAARPKAAPALRVSSKSSTDGMTLTGARLDRWATTSCLLMMSATSTTPATTSSSGQAARRGDRLGAASRRRRVGLRQHGGHRWRIGDPGERLPAGRSCRTGCARSALPRPQSRCDRG